MGLLTPLKWHTYRAGRRVVREWHGLWRDQRLDTLEAADAPLAGALARALRRTAADGDAEAIRWRERIEEERARMLRSNEPIATPEDRAGTEKEGLTLAKACAASIAPPAGTMLHHLIKETRPKVALELGTNVGISSAYQASALASLQGELVTFEGMQGRLRQARALHERLGLDNLEYRLGPFQETLEPALEEIGPVDYALIDGHHQYEPTLNYFDLICRHSADTAVFVFDDIRWSRGMRRAWDALRRDPRVRTAIDLYWMGICVTGSPGAGERHHGLVELWVERGK